MASIYDYIIVGAGSAGCVLANRLSADPAVQVLLVEAGGEDNNPFIHVPMGIGKTLTNPGLNWYYMTEPEAGNAFRPRVWMRGKVLGGSSAINGMMYMRGQPQDYEDWEAAGNTGWGWAEIGRCFRAIEDHELGDDGVRGVGGPLHISIQPHRSPLTEAVLQAGTKMGLERRDDINRPQQEGIAYTPVTIKSGKRVSAADAFLKPARNRPNLTVLTNTLVRRVLFEGTRAVGVETGPAESAVQYRTRGDVILSAGAIESPKLLQLSGIGPRDLLDELGIPVIVDNPSVGANMREHKVLTQVLRLNRPYSHNVALQGPRLYWNALKYLLLRSGPLASTYDITAFIRTDSSLTRPDAQLTFWSLTWDRSVQGMQLEKPPGMLVMGYPLRTRSEGSVRARSRDPAAPPIVSTNFLDHEYDRRVIVGMFRYMRRFIEQSPFRALVDHEAAPGMAVQTDEEIIEACRQDDTCMHAIGTCKMGVDAAAVVDPELRVRGTTGLRVVDCSVMPTQVSGNTNGPVMALAWRAAELIRDPQRSLSAATA
jgi:choline dehydrogenase-like flavoprotein